MTHPYTMNLPAADLVATSKLLQYLITECHIIEELLLYDYDATQNPVALKYTHTCTTFNMDAILQYLTSDTVNDIPENVAIFYDLFMRGVSKTFWNTRKRKILQYMVETASHDIESQFAYLNSNDRSQANSLLRCMMNDDLGGRLTKEDVIDDAEEGLCIKFSNNVKGGRLRDYICYLIGRKNCIKPVFMVYFFNLYVSGVNCYPLIPTHVLKQFIAEENLPERKALAKSFPLPPVMEQVVAKLKGSVLYAKGRKLSFELSQFLGAAYTVERETHRIIYRDHEDDRCIGSCMENMLRFLIGAHSPRRQVLFDALTFFKEVIEANDIDETLFGKGTLAFLRYLNNQTALSDTQSVAADQGQKPVLCPQCACVFGPKGATIKLTEIYTVPFKKHPLPEPDDIFLFQPPVPKLLRTDSIVLNAEKDGATLMLADNEEPHMNLEAIEESNELRE